MLLKGITETDTIYCAVVDTNLLLYYGSPHKLNVGAILICRQGEITLSVNLDIYHLRPGSIFCVLPRDILEVKEMTEDFTATALIMNPSVMGEASTRLEHFIFDTLHANPLIDYEDGKMNLFLENITENIKLFCNSDNSTRSDDFALLQVRSLFLILSDYAKRKYSVEEPRAYSRIEEHFKIFVSELTDDFKSSREVSYYANKMNITPKYLNYIVQSLAHKTCKSIIDAYVIMQLKLELRNTEKSVQEIAYEYNFPNQSFLGSYFKKFVGVSPRLFRNDV